MHPPAVRASREARGIRPRHLVRAKVRHNVPAVSSAARAPRGASEGAREPDVTRLRGDLAHVLQSGLKSARPVKVGDGDLAFQR